MTYKQSAYQSYRRIQQQFARKSTAVRKSSSVRHANRRPAQNTDFPPLGHGRYSIWCNQVATVMFVT